LRAIDAYGQAGAPVPAELYADMLEIATQNWGYFQHLPDDAEVLRLLDEGERVARTSGDDVSLARLLTERSSFTDEVTGAEEMRRFVASADAVRFADAAQRMAMVYEWNGKIGEALELFETIFGKLLPAGAAINEPEALIWYSLAKLHAGDVERADALADRLLDEATRRSAHTRQHAYALEAFVRLVRGDWATVTNTARELAGLVDANPD